MTRAHPPVRLRLLHTTVSSDEGFMQYWRRLTSLTMISVRDGSPDALMQVAHAIAF